MKSDKRIMRLLSKPRDYTFDEAESLMKSLGYKLQHKGSTSGSRVIFYRESDGASILLHKPHPSKVLKMYSVTDLINALKQKGDIE